MNMGSSSSREARSRAVIFGLWWTTSEPEPLTVGVEGALSAAVCTMKGLLTGIFSGKQSIMVSQKTEKREYNQKRKTVKSFYWKIFERITLSHGIL